MFGLNLTSLSVQFQKLQVSKCLLLKNSSDRKIQCLYSYKTEKDKNSKRWKATKLTSKVEAIVNHDISFQAQSHRLGLGWNIYNPNPSVKERRKLASQTVGKLEAEHLLSHAISLPLNGAWTTWMDRAEPFNLTWKNLIFGPGSKLLSFVLNSTANSVITPAMLQMLGYSESSACPLCEKPKCSLFHILSNCQSALDRYIYLET